MKNKINLLKIFLGLKQAIATYSNPNVFTGEKVYCWKDGFYLSLPFESGINEKFATDLKEFVRIADGKDFLTFEIQDESIKIKVDKTRFKIPQISLECVQEELDLSAANCIDFNNSNVFLENLKKAEKFIAISDVRHYLEGLSLKGTEMGATNGHIAIKIADCGFNAEKPIIIPRVTVEFLLKSKLNIKTIFLQDDENGTPNRISFQFETGEIFSSPLIDAKFPDLSNVVTVDENAEANELPIEFFDTLKSLKAKDKSISVRLTPTLIDIIDGETEAVADIELPGMIDGVGFRYEYLLMLENLAFKLFYSQPDIDAALMAFNEDKNIMVALMPVRI